jgi:hypothetical protein
MSLSSVTIAVKEAQASAPSTKDLELRDWLILSYSDGVIPGTTSMGGDP